MGLMVFGVIIILVTIAGLLMAIAGSLHKIYKLLRDRLPNDEAKILGVSRTENTWLVQCCKILRRDVLRFKDRAGLPYSDCISLRPEHYGVAAFGLIQTLLLV